MRRFGSMRGVCLVSLPPQAAPPISEVFYVVVGADDGQVLLRAMKYPRHPRAADT